MSRGVSGIPPKAQMIALLVASGARTERELQGKTPAQIFHQDYRPTFSKDKVLTTDQVRRIGDGLGWDQGKLDAAIVRANGGRRADSEITNQEFNRLVADMGGKTPAVMLQTLLTDHVTFKTWPVDRKAFKDVQAEAESQVNAFLAVAKDDTRPAAERHQAADEAIKLARGYDAAVTATGMFPNFTFGKYTNRPPAYRSLAKMAKTAKELKTTIDQASAAAASQPKTAGVASTLPQRQPLDLGALQAEVTQATTPAVRRALKAVSDGKVESQKDFVTAMLGAKDPASIDALRELAKERAAATGDALWKDLHAALDTTASQTFVALTPDFKRTKLRQTIDQQDWNKLGIQEPPKPKPAQTTSARQPVNNQAATARQAANSGGLAGAIRQNRPIAFTGVVGIPGMALAFSR
ncbi:MAG: hypothetical protein VKP62_15480 [Candidatus Sericytochromatia bacterium]|nr:hypothetical protein [Candidatus Sericytochromatia bacterium]